MLAVEPRKYVEAYSCIRDCQRSRGWDLDRRRARGCTRTDLPPVVWQITARELLQLPTSDPINAAPYRGRYPDRSLEGSEDMIPVDPKQPHELTADGCPGGWYRTRWVNSISVYTRTRTEHGGRVDNPRFSAASWQTQEAVMHFEHEQERRIAWSAEFFHTRDADRRAVKEAGRGSRR